MTLRADLHVHTCLSPCASLDMSPRAVVHAAKAAGLDLIGVTDHNATHNCPTVERLARQAGLACLYGAEVTTAEEAHVLCLFGTSREAEEFGAFVASHLPAMPHDPERFGDQVYVDEDDVILGDVSASLLGACTVSAEALLSHVHRRGGIFVPAHIDRPSWSLCSQLGFLPNYDYDAVEVTKAAAAGWAAGYTAIVSSDAHELADVGRQSVTLRARGTGIESLRDALRNGRVYLPDQS
jgi:3',5'-nucleoside bisphosphate phosphatase